LAHTITEMSKSKIYWEGQQVWGSGRANIAVEDRWKTLLKRGSQSFVLVKLSTDWMRPACIMKSNLLYLKCTDLNVSLTPKHVHRNIQKFWLHIWAPGATMLTCKTNHRHQETEAQGSTKSWTVPAFTWTWKQPLHLEIRPQPRLTRSLQLSEEF
jgi:hypothetical protein